RVAGRLGAADEHVGDVVHQDAVAGVGRGFGADDVALDLQARRGGAEHFDAVLGVADDGVAGPGVDAADERFAGVLDADAVEVVGEHVGRVADGRALDPGAVAVEQVDAVGAAALDPDPGAGLEAADGVVVGAVDPDALAAGAAGPDRGDREPDG